MSTAEGPAGSSELSPIQTVLRSAKRRYRIDSIGGPFTLLGERDAATRVALAIEQARQAITRQQAPKPALKCDFIKALDLMIRAALDPLHGDSAFQANVLLHQAGPAQEYAALAKTARADRRAIATAVNAAAHPGKLASEPAGHHRDALAHLHTRMVSASWRELAEAARDLLGMAQAIQNAPLCTKLTEILESAELARLIRLQVLESDDQVLAYQTLRNKAGPRAGSPEAVTSGIVSQKRGRSTERRAAQALETLCTHLNSKLQAGERPYRVITSLHIPSAIGADRRHAKTEWDAVLLRQTATQGAAAATIWEVCALVEAKASADAAADDLPKLRRGLRLLMEIADVAVRPFQTSQGRVALDSRSLRRLKIDKEDMADVVFYCSDAQATAPQRWLTAASRMRLLTSAQSLDYAGTLQATGQCEHAELESLWNDVLSCPRWKDVLNQYVTLSDARELMIHPDDLLAAIASL